MVSSRPAVDIAVQADFPKKFRRVRMAGASFGDIRRAGRSCET
jgi:hypothetical protein